jgi:hypothetical protein
VEFRISARNLSRVLAMAKAVHQGGMAYFPGWSDRPDENPPVGTVLYVVDQHLVACFMEHCDRLIVHACVPCERLTSGWDGLFAITAPNKFHTLLARFKDEPITVELDGGRAKLHLPSPGSLKRNVSLPLQSVKGAMLSQVHTSVSSSSVIVDHKEMSTALNALPRDGECLSATNCRFTAVAGHAGLALWSENQYRQTHIHLECTPLGGADPDAQHTWPARRSRGLRRVLTAMRRGDGPLVVRVSPERITLSNDWFTAQFYTFVGDAKNAIRPIPLTVPARDDLVLELDPESATVAKDWGRWIRRLVLSANNSRNPPSTSWHLTQRGVTLSVSAGLETSVDIDARCLKWTLPARDLKTTVQPLTTADLLDLILNATASVQLIVRADRIMIQSTKQGIEMIQTKSVREDY